MDSVVTVNRSFLNRIRGFCNIFASLCDRCYRHPCSCGMENEIAIAKNLIVEIDHLRNAKEEQFYIENPFDEFLDCVQKAIEQAGKPIRSNEIVIRGECRQRKFRALKILLKRRRIVKTVVDGTPFYSLPEMEAQTGTTNTQKENANGV